MATVDSGTFDRTALAALVAIECHTSTGDISNVEAVERLRRLDKGLRACIINGTPIVPITKADLTAAIAAPPEKEKTNG